MLAGQRASRVDAGVEDGLGELARPLGLPGGGVVEHERMEVAVPRVEDVADLQAMLVGQLLDPPEHLRQPRSRHDAILHVVVGGDATHRGERRLSPLPEKCAVGVGGGGA